MLKVSKIIKSHSKWTQFHWNFPKTSNRILFLCKSSSALIFLRSLSLSLTLLTNTIKNLLFFRRAVNDKCKIIFEEIKKDKKHRYVIFNIVNEKQIDVEVVGDRDAEYDQFLEDLQKGGTGECRYGLFDFEYMHQHQGTTESSKKQKLFLLLWCPDTAKIKMKMLYASSFDALKKSLVGVQKYIQASDLSEASKESVEEKLRATDRV